MTLLERDDFIRTLVDYATEASQGDSRLVLIAGEAGIGKTALLEAVENNVDSRWLWSMCDGSSTPQPLGPVFDLAQQMGGPLLDATRAGTSGPALVRTLLNELTLADGPSVVVIEDIHWADEATLDLLRFLARRLTNCQVMLITTYRDDALTDDAPLRAALGELATQRATRRMNLPPLSRRAVDHLAAGTEIQSGELFRLTAGNPFFVTEVLQAGIDPIPLTAQEAVLSRLARLSAPARAVIDTLSVFGTRTDVDLLRRTIDAPDTVIGECLTAGVIASDSGGLRFRHELARLAVEGALPGHRRRDLHARALASLEASSSCDDSRLAHHAEEAGDSDAVLRYAPLAAVRAAELSAHRESAAQYERALRYADGCDPIVRAELFGGLATQTSLFDQWERSAESRETELELWRTVGDDLRVGDSLRLLSRAYWRLLRGEEAEAASIQALDTLQALPPSRELAWAYANLAGSRMTAGKDDEAIAWARRAQELARDFEDQQVLSDAMNTEACSLSNMADADPDSATALLREALELALAHGAEAQAARAYSNLQGILTAERRLAEVEVLYHEAIAYCDDLDLGTYSACIRGEHTQLLAMTGRWDEAESLSTDLLQTAPSPVNSLNPSLTLAHIRMRRGASDASDLMARNTSMTESNGEPQWMIRARLCAIEAAWASGRPDQAAQLARDTIGIATQCDSWDQGAVSVWLRRLGCDEPPLRWIAEPYARQLDGDWEGAASMWKRFGCPFDEALALLDADDEDALREAHSIFTRLGAEPAAAMTRAAMRRIGVITVPRGPRGQTRDDPFGLTHRERQVLELLRDGSTNADIASTLVISERTVSHHVSAILSKLGVASRRDAARLAREDTIKVTAAK